MPANYPPPLNQIRWHHRARMFALAQRKRLDNSILAFVRVNALGWHRGHPDADALAERAKEIVDGMEADLAQAVKRIVAAEFPTGKRAALKRADVRSLAATSAAEARPGDSEEQAAVRPVVIQSLLARKPWNDLEAEHLKAGIALVKTLPVWPQAEAIDGLKEGATLFMILGECGDLGNYANPGKLWKRMGLGVYDGHACSTWRRESYRPRALSADEWVELGYVARRTAMMRQLSEAIIRNNLPLRRVYDERKAYLRARWERDGYAVKPAKEIKPGENAVSNGKISKDAKRYLEKRVLKLLWQAWRDDPPAVEEKQDAA